MKIGTKVCLFVLAVAAELLLLSPPGDVGAGGNPNDGVQIGVVKSMFRDAPPSMINILSRPLQALMVSETGMTGKLEVAADAFTLGQQLKDRKVQLGVFHGFEFAWARQKNPGLEPLVIAVCKHRLLHANLVVRKENPCTGCTALEGKVLALARLSREHCHLFLERRCPGEGRDPHKFFSKITTPSDAEEALDDVVDGTAQATIVDHIALDAYRACKPARSERLRVLKQSEGFPAAVVAYQPGALDEATLRRFRDGMIGANKTERGKALLKLCRISGFEAVPDDYSRALEEIARAYPPVPTRK